MAVLLPTWQNTTSLFSAKETIMGVRHAFALDSNVSYCFIFLLITNQLHLIQKEGSIVLMSYMQNGLKWRKVLPTRRICRDQLNSRYSFCLSHKHPQKKTEKIINKKKHTPFLKSHFQNFHESQCQKKKKCYSQHFPIQYIQPHPFLFFIWLLLFYMFFIINS